MRPFRFPRLTILLMIACFLTLLAAIGLATEMARTVQMNYAGAANLSPMWWAKLPALFGLVFVLLWSVGAVGYGIVFVLRRSGVHRLAGVQSWSAHK